ncbi:MAG: glucoamylase family protein [Candidatus Ozemobacteraceae bacterium]
MRLRGDQPAHKFVGDELPLKSELFSAAQMEQHGKALAATHTLSTDYISEQLLTRLGENEGILHEVRRLFADAVKGNRRITPAGEWLLDNFYLIEEQIRTAKKHLPKRYSKALPRLKTGPSKGLPRVYDIALETISHGDGRVDPESLSSFVTAYQASTILQLGELWAIPIMLRLALIENLRRVALRIAADRIGRNHADFWADRITETAERNPKDLILVIADMARSKPPMVSSFVAELTRRLKGQGHALALPLTWIEQQLSETGLTIDLFVQAENQQQAADQVSISNSIGSLRFLGAMDWRKFVETMSVVEQTLLGDPAGVYGLMDFATRDQYRHSVEKIAKRCPLSENEVARAAIRLAGKGDGLPAGDNRMNHVGFYLMGKGLTLLEDCVGVRPSFTEGIRKVIQRFPLFIYLGSTGLLTAIFIGYLLAEAHSSGLHGLLVWVIGLLSLLCVSQLAIALVNLFMTHLVAPQPLPRMDFSKKIPPESSTLVVVPTMLTGTENIEHLMEALEVRFLANRDENLLFALLTDFRDASEETQPDDELLLLLARQKIEELNEKYKTTVNDLFFLFHRPRRFNPQDQIWMGYERKRGKLAELNSFLRGGSNGCFSLIVGNTNELGRVKYVITLDTDTQLPRDAARQLVGTMAHPLNRPQYDEKRQCVCAGYGILQPRVAASLPGTNRSRYARMWGSDAGIDPYTRVISDVYQDIFAEGSFIGKGIYEVDAFEQALRGCFPENRILSHDLIEGCYARAGLLSDVQLYEEYPSCYSADVSRRHRWIRGDWQLLQWLLPKVPGPDGSLRNNPLSLLSKWKIFDNLRRSLSPLAMTLLFLLGWTVLPMPWFWTLSVMGILLIPSLITSLLDLFQKPDDVLPSQHILANVRGCGRSLGQIAFSLLCLPYEAFFSIDAVVRTIWRMLVGQKRLLEWNPSGDSDRTNRKGLAGAWRTMWISPAIAVGTAIYLEFSRPEAFVVALPVLVFWFISPIIAWWISEPLHPRQAKLRSDQIRFLRKMARKTWGFFETFVSPEDHWLPPDNFQEHPLAKIAHRTSPTNMGLALLANLSAWDFGYICTGQLIERTTNAFRTMESMERHKGHFYNWYDTESLKPLLPMYISTVDSGNLAAHLLTLRAGLLAVPDEKLIGSKIFDGLSDTLKILMDFAGESASVPFIQAQDDLAFLSASPPSTLEAARESLCKLAASALHIFHGFDSDPGSLAVWWARAFSNQCREALDDLEFFATWTVLSLSPKELSEFPVLCDIPTLRQLSSLDEKLLPAMADRYVGTPEKRSHFDGIQKAIRDASERARARIAVIEGLALQSSEFAKIDYDFLYDEDRHLLAIGYNIGENRRDASYYDLLASEARLASFVAIAQGKLPQESWFSLGRLLTTAGGEPILLSWSGSMFEYLMPLLVMPTYEHTLLDETYKSVVTRQIEYGNYRGVPWGVSESGNNTFDGHLNYQYCAVGVPGLGLKRGLAEDLVVAPYASALALMVAPEEACRNLEKLSAQGFEGKYGFYEAIDYTHSHLPHGKSSMVVRSFMAHHQGMSLLSLAFLLLNRPMQRRFESDPSFQAILLLLQERVPKATAFRTHTTKLGEIPNASHEIKEMPIRVFTSPDTPIPEVQLLSNGRYHVMITNAGGGYSRWKDLAVTRWREDSTCDNWGAFCYIRSVATGAFWSTAYQPALKASKQYEAIFSEGRAEFRRRDQDFDTHTEIAVSPEDDIELRRITITNRAWKRRTIEVTSYAEVVLSLPAQDALHPAFSNLFVQTEIIRDKRAILCTRRPRSLDEKAPWMLHLVAVHGAESGEVSYETDRMKFIGRGNTIVDPEAMGSSSRLSDSEGSVLDPIVAIRNRITIDSKKSVTIIIVTGIAETRDSCISLVGKYQDRHLADRVFDLAWTHSQVLLRQINATEADAQLYGRLAASVIYANASMRAGPGALIKNRRGQSGLWGYSVSGDLPIVLLQIEDSANINLVRQLVQAHAYWRLKGLAVDLIIWNEDHAGYRQLLHEQIMALIAEGSEANVTDRPGGIFVRASDQISKEDRVLFQAVARVIITDRRGVLTDQFKQRGPMEKVLPASLPTRTTRGEAAEIPVKPPQNLVFANGLGGFTPDGREYVISTVRGKVTPAPWVNVLANRLFGTVVSENGVSYTWSENAHEFRLTPWCNDPVSDSSGEAFYLRDEERGAFWSPMPLPSRGAMPYVTRHGFGYSVFEHTEHGISTEVWIYVALEAAVKFTVMKVRNRSGRSRRLSATGYVEWVLGDLRSKSAMHISTEINPLSGALFARNPYNADFGDRTAFFNVDGPTRTMSGDRMEFLGRNGTFANPGAMGRSHLSGKLGAGLDPCGAIQVAFELADGEEREIVFTLGAGNDADDAANLAQRFRGAGAARKALEAVWQYWKHTLGAVSVETPDQSLNMLVNGWLLYQTLACRLWARSGYYQSGGAFGFRDQLQDVMALIYTEPRLVREHILLAAGRQFSEGDVQHWWHPPQGRGVRTRCSDDYLWLPLATSRYVRISGDYGVLDEAIPFLQGRPIEAKMDSYFDLPGRSQETASLYEHCVRAIMKGLNVGEHGLPLMGSGDWNDGMNMVGLEGKGESVWLGFFLCDVLTQFTEVARRRGDLVFVERLTVEAYQMRHNIEQHGWDGGWYRRAYFDDGMPLGSISNPECQIDSVVQSWSVLSGAGDPKRAHLAMGAADKRLVHRDQGLIQLLDPPFDTSDLNPGYIKGYVPGVRENGGQYTHAAIWMAMAFAQLGDSKRAWELMGLINPVSHSSSPESMAIYKVEPYVVAADVYALSPHVGRGGWTWYTGSAGWMYRLILESLLGLRLEVDKLHFAPLLPAAWNGFTLHYRYRETIYHIAILRGKVGDAATGVTVDGVLQHETTLTLVDDHQEHTAKVKLSGI